MKSTGRTCAVCGKAYKGKPHNHAQMGLPKSVQDMGPVATPRPMVGTPPSKPTRAVKSKGY